MEVMKVKFLKDWLSYKKEETLVNDGGTFVPKDNLGQVKGLKVLKYMDICYLINSGTLMIKEILSPNHDGEDENTEIDYYV